MPNLQHDTPALEGFRTRHELSLEDLCRRIHARHQATIRVKKPHVAVANLARIVATTLELSNRAGFHSMSLRDLAEASGLSMGALYAYFDSKETLLMMILGQVEDAVARTLTPPAGLTDPRARLRWFVETHVLLTEAMQPWFTFAFMEAKSFPEQGRKFARESELHTESLLAAILAEGAASGVFVTTELTAALIKPLLQDWYVKRWKYRRRGVGPHAYAASVTAFVEAALGATGSADATLRHLC